MKCKHDENTAIAHLDGDYLCQHHADLWVQAETDNEWEGWQDYVPCGDS